MCLIADGLGKANALSTVVEDTVVGTDEGVSEDPVVGGGTLDTSLADGPAEDGLLEDVDGGGDGVGDLVDGDGEGGEAVEVGAVRGDVEGREDLVDGVTGTNDDGGTGVDDSLAGGAAEGDGGGADRDGVELDGVVVALVEVEVVVGDGSSVVGRVSASEDEGAVVASVGGVEVEGEDGAGDGALGDGVIEPGGDLVGRDGDVGKTEDTVERRSLEEISELSGDGELLLLDEDTSDRDVIVDEGSLHAAGSVGDGDGLSVVLVGGGLTALVLVLSVAALVVTGGGGDPEVGGSSVHDGGEDLGRCSDGDDSVVLRVLGVGELLGGEGGLGSAELLLLLRGEATKGNLDDVCGTQSDEEGDDDKDGGGLHLPFAVFDCEFVIVVRRFLAP